MKKAKKFVCTSIFNGEPKLSDFQLKTEELPKLEDGGNVKNKEYSKQVVIVH